MADKDIVKVLKDARRLIRKGWVQNSEAEDEYGHAVTPYSLNAVSFCVMGAIQKETNGKPYKVQKEAEDVLGRAIDRIWHRRTVGHIARTIVQFNDARGRTKSQVLKAFDLAIQLAEKE